MCVEAEAPGGLCLERDVPSSRRASQMVGVGGLPPPGQIGRTKLFEAGKHRLTGMADGSVCVCVHDSVRGNSELAPRFQKCLTNHEAGCGGQGPLGLVFLEGFSGKVLRGSGGKHTSAEPQ